MRAPNLLAVLLTALVMGGGAVSVRCMDQTRARCSWGTLTGDAPKLDVPHLGTRPGAVAAMLDLADVRPGDRVLDLGTGDGRILIAAARRGATGVGVDLDPAMVAEANASARRAGVAGRVRFVEGNVFATPLGGYDVVTMFLLPQVNIRLRPRLLTDLAPGARIVSHAFDMGDWRPDATARSGGSRLYLWRVPPRRRPPRP